MRSTPKRDEGLNEMMMESILESQVDSKMDFQEAPSGPANGALRSPSGLPNGAPRSPKRGPKSSPKWNSKGVETELRSNSQIIFIQVPRILQCSPKVGTIMSNEYRPRNIAVLGIGGLSNFAIGNCRR